MTATLDAATLDDYVSLLGEAEINELRALARALNERDVLMVNSTAVGGGVAEILNRLVPMAGQLGGNTGWEVAARGLRNLSGLQRAQPGQARPRRALCRHSRSAAAAAHLRTPAGRRPLDLAVPHRSLPPKPGGLGLSQAVRRPLRRRSLPAGLHPRFRPPGGVCLDVTRREREAPCIQQVAELLGYSTVIWLSEDNTAAAKAFYKQRTVK